ncbi:MAG: recombination protein NinB [Clostridium sp.]|nr:recombination protein NinB [Clostridium sp.]
MLYDLQNELQAVNFKARCNALFSKKCVVELTEKRPQRSLRQNAYLHAALGYFGLQFGYTLDEVKDWYFKDTCNPELFVRQRTDSLTGEQRKVFRSSAELTTEEMTTAIERFRNWASKVAGVYIPSPDEHRLVTQMEIEAQRGKMYL